MGAQVAFEDAHERCGEPVGRVVVGGSIDAPVALGAADVPGMIDELPILACLAAYAPGESRVTGAEELRVKESDRIAAVVANLTALGADAAELPDGIVVRGPCGALRGLVRTHGDHRIAMAFGVLAALPGNDISIDDRDCAGVSFPGFWVELERLATH
jgi:3-phosphoshikimate 1-carboxyvinyltransferase